MSHTKGPWSIMQSFDGRETFVVSGDPVQPFKGHLIAAKTTCPDWDANAHLISAAPDLLEALTAYVSLCGNTAHAVDREGSQGAFDMAMSAIRKATGKD